MVNIAIIGLQWGDEGKGKVVDFLSGGFDAVIRFQGGHNAGHTIKVDDKTYKLSLLPSGLVRGKFSVIGSGVVVDPFALLNEMESISKNGVSVTPGNLNIADNACLIVPLYTEIDSLLEQQKGNNKIGTTGRGIGPAYEDKAGRRAIRICDLYDEENLVERIENLLFYHNILRKGMGASEVSVDSLLKSLNEIKDQIRPFIFSPHEIAQKLESDCKSILFEGAQGVMLDNDYGTYPFVTSSNTISGQAAIGSCLGAHHLHKSVGIVKAYTTRVGSGPFPTELTDDIGSLLQSQGHEFGTVTGRDRRCGWFDAVLVSQTARLCSVKSVTLTKLDVLDGLDTIKICTKYEYNGQEYSYLPSSISMQKSVVPIYEEIPGWKTSTAGVNNIKDLPENAIKYIQRIEELCGFKVDIISTGPDRNHTIIANDILK